MRASKILLRNLRSLMESNNMNMADVARASGLTPRYIKFILDGERKPTVDAAESLAKGFGLSVWQILLPELDHSFIESPGLAELVNLYVLTDNDGRKFIKEVAERESSRSAPHN